MKIVILGCGRVGSILARQLQENGHEVTVIDRNPDSFRRLAELPVRQVVGSGIEEAVLKRAGIESADAFIAVTNGDNTNIMSVQIARMQFNIAKTVARIYDPIRAEAYRRMGINTICTSLLGAGLLRDYVEGKAWGKVSDYLAPIEDALPGGEEA